MSRTPDTRTPPLAVVFGGSGFLGRYIVRRLAREGWRVRVPVRRPNEALFLCPYGAVGQVVPEFCNIRDEASVASALRGARVAINCVGTFDAGGRNNFTAVHVEGAARIARLATARGTERLVHVSAIGAAADSRSHYFRSKAEGEAAVLAAFPAATILRPSVMFGQDDSFFNRFGGIAKLSPVVPLVGARTRFQPVYVDDVAEAAVLAAAGRATGLHELAGPGTATLRELIADLLAETRQRRLVLSLPFWLGRLAGATLDLGVALTGRTISNRILTRDQARQLQTDVVAGGALPGLADLGIVPTAMAAILPEYLWRYRPSGQFVAIKESAKRLRDS